MTSQCTSGGVGHSNLGGLGPDAGAAELRYKGVALRIDGSLLDLVITNTSEYYSPNPEWNGCSGGGVFGQISMDRGQDCWCRYPLWPVVRAGTEGLAIASSARLR